MNGIDVYTGQGIIDWRTVALTQGFAMIKASQGRGETSATDTTKPIISSTLSHRTGTRFRSGRRLTSSLTDTLAISASPI